MLVNQASHLARIARNLERTADQIPHICGWIAFAVTGEIDSEPDELASAIRTTGTIPSDSEGEEEKSLLIKPGGPK